ncbi:MAG: 2-succinyl-5-enolpyruvyl-6-hydroxy-3-cyclohexene-1-carboxylic-acid synthase [Candidatus Dormibacteraeota bacterium]|nr:2-succinyl-5-enolpyruvyl-6-hydroxy-3-cyclohexene-1-carboxylic-acid synthase [Candidatus Dormibacteraeota bacterium]
MADAGDVALACCALLVDELVRGGVRHACLTPGSRSTPLALAVARNTDIDVHVHVDERSSAYYALGIAKASGAAVIALCSSGTAVANHFPAVVEASMAREPLIVLTADRPPELHGVGANQTIDQQRLFGGFMRWFSDSGVPTIEGDALSHWRDIGRQAVTAAMSHPRGPVHINLPFREPLVPSGEPVSFDAGAPAEHEQVTVGALAAPSADHVRELEWLLASPLRVAVVAGTLSQSALRMPALAASRGWPVLAEPTSQLRGPVSALSIPELLVADESFREQHRADVVLQLGAAPTTRAMQRFVREAETLVIVDPAGIVGDPDRRAALRLECDVDELAHQLMPAERNGEMVPDGAWIASWRHADELVRQAVDRLLDSWDEPFEGRIARDTAAVVPENGPLVVASSMPVRDLAMFMAPRSQAMTVLANRGASGIDGTVSTALGVAAVSPNTHALVGDLALLHDASALLWSAGRGRDLVLVVVDNDGGGIFSLLPQASLDTQEFELLFATPHGSSLDVAALAHAAAAGYREVTSASAFIPAVRAAQSSRGVQLIHVRIDRARAPRMRNEVRRCVRETLQRLG